MRRVAIIGCAGAGKSTLARRMGRRLGLPVVHLDSLYWKPGWVETPRPQFEQQVLQILAGESWIVDGNYGGTMEPRLQRADTVVFIDPPRWLCLWRILRRRMTYAGRTRPDMGPGCPEQLDIEFVDWVWGFRRHDRPRILERLTRFAPGRDVHILHSPAEVERFVQQLPHPKQP